MTYVKVHSHSKELLSFSLICKTSSEIFIVHNVECCVAWMINLSYWTTMLSSQNRTFDSVITILLSAIEFEVFKRLQISVTDLRSSNVSIKNFVVGMSIFNGVWSFIFKNLNNCTVFIANCSHYVCITLLSSAKWPSTAKMVIPAKIESTCLSR